MPSYYNENGEILFTINNNPDTCDSLDLDGLFSIDAVLEVGKYYVINGQVIEIPVAPSDFHTFNYLTKTFDLNLERLQFCYKRMINMEASDVILARYPDYLQRNLLAQNDSQAIDIAWTWINSIRDASNIANDQLLSLETYEEISNLYINYSQGLQQL
jgi:hypothetical protein